MPYDNVPESEWPNMEKCVIDVMAQGKDKEAAIAICYASIMEKAQKAADELDVLGCPYGGPVNGRDKDGQYFDPSTNFHADKIPLPPVVYYHGRDADATFIGQTVKRWRDAAGEWFRVKLDTAQAKARELLVKAAENKVAASSGAVPAIARAAPDGKITDWLVGELSLFETDTGKRPANSYAVALPVLKALYQKAGIALPDFGAGENSEAAPAGAAAVNAGATQTPLDRKEKPEMDASEIVALLDKREAEKAAAQKAEAERQAAIEAEVKARTEKAMAEREAEYAKTARLPMGMGAAYVAKFADQWKYDDLDAANTAAVGAYLLACHGRPSPALIKALARKMDENEKAAGIYQKAVSKTRAMTGFDTAIWQKSDEVFNTGAGGQAADWVGTAYSNMLWTKVRSPMNALGRVPEVIVPQGYSSIYFPVEAADPTLYTISESADTTSNEVAVRFTVGTTQADNKQLTLGNLGGMVYVSYEAEEDSIVDAIRQNSDQLAMAMAEGAEALFFDGDSTSGSANINDRDGTGAATNWYIAANGVRKYCLVTNTGQARSAANSLTASDFKKTLQLLGASGIAADPTKVAFYMSMPAWWKALDLVEISTQDVARDNTIRTGKMPTMYGVEVLPSAFICKAQANRWCDEEGFIDTTDADNDFGCFMAVRFDSWKFAHKVLVRLESQREPKRGVTCITANSRLGFGARDTTTAAALTYYVGA